MLNKSIKNWVGECMRKKKLKESWADRTIQKAKKEGNTLHKYYCPHCQHWHVSKLPGRYEDLKKAS